MRHNIIVEGRRYRLRPVAIEDSSFIVQLRTDPQKSRFINTTSTVTADQEIWLKSYFDTEGDFYFIVEHKDTGESEGTIGIYKLDPLKKYAEWGRWILRPNSKAALESVLLIYQVAFEILDLEMLYCRTAIENAQVVLFHKTLGLETHAKLPSHLCIEGVFYDVLEQRMTKERWKKSKAALESKANWIDNSQE